MFTFRVPTTIADLMRDNVLSVFNERDPDARRAAIRRIYAPDATFSDEEGVIRGPDALDAKVQRLLDGTPAEFVFRVAGPVRGSSDLGMLNWHLGPEGAPPVVTGTDVVVVRDGRIAAAYTFLDDRADDGGGH